MNNHINRQTLLRGACIALVFVLAAAGLTWRLTTIQIDEYDTWRGYASAQQLSNNEVAAQRGTIYDSNGNVMAQSVVVWTIEASPDVIAKLKITDEMIAKAGTDDWARLAARELARILDLDEETLYANLSDSDSRWYKIKAKVDKPEADEVRAFLKEYGFGTSIYLTQDTKRYYPYGELGSTVLGFVSDDGGAAGIEYQYEDTLGGTAGREVSVVNAFGGEMHSGSDSFTYDAIDGYDLELTINAEIQSILENYLGRAVEENNAKERGMGIVMDVNTGAILAMASYPAYDPNDPYYIYDNATREAIQAIENDDERREAASAAISQQWRNKALNDAYEPGSVMKIITASAALDSGVFGVDSMFMCGSKIEVGGHTINCAQGKNHGSLTLAQALIESCNVSFVKMSAELGVSTWYDYINAFGFTEPTGVDLPGEPSQASIDAALVYSEARMGVTELASCSFGQSNKYTPLQMITGVAAAVNGGYLMQPYVVSKVMDSNGNVVESFEPTVKRQVISNETSAAIASILEDLVSDDSSSGKNAYVAGYHVGGKSGTSEKLDVRAQEGRDAYVSSFLGFAPANNPQVAVLIALDDPDDNSGLGTYFGGRLAGPAVGSIIKEIMPIVGVDPDYTNNEDLMRTTVTTPDLTGDLQAGLVTLNQKGLDYIVVGGGNSITAQYPEAHTSVPYGGQIILYTDGAEAQAVQVPDVTGQTPANARDTLKSMGLNVITAGAPDSSDGVVVQSQSLEPGSEVPKGATVTLTLYDGTSTSD